MEAIIYSATDLRDRRTEILGAAASGRALVRAVDGTALVMTRLDVVERDRLVADWSLDLHEVEAGRTPRRLTWLQHLDDGDRAEFLSELWQALAEVRDGGADPGTVEHVVAAWRTTAQVLSDPVRREVLLGELSPGDLIAAERPR